MTEEKVYFKNFAGEKIAGLLAMPETTGLFPVVIGCHGFRTSKDGSKLTELSKRFTKKGIALLRFDFSGLGQSEGDFYDTTIGKNVDELENAIEFVKQDKRIDNSRIGILGSSMGGMVTIIEAAKNPDIAALGLVAPVTVFNFDKHYTEEELKQAQRRGYVNTTAVGTGITYKLNFEFITEAKKYDLMSLGEKIRCPVLLINGTQDKSCSIDKAQVFFEKLNCEKKFVKIGGCGHRFEKPEYFETLIDYIVDFFKLVYD